MGITRMNNQIEEYRLQINERIDDKLKLFAAYTDTIYLGESGISNWDWFEDLIWTSFEYRNFRVQVDHCGQCRLSGRDLKLYLEIILEIKAEHPDKLRLVGLARWGGFRRTFNYALRGRIGYLYARAKGRRSMMWDD